MTIGEKIVKQLFDIELPCSDLYVERWIDVKGLTEAIDAAIKAAYDHGFEDGKGSAEFDFDERIAVFRREALEEVCKVECVLCRDGEPLVAPDADNLWRHQVRRNGTPLILPCNATRIRELMAEVR